MTLQRIFRTSVIVVALLTCNRSMAARSDVETDPAYEGDIRNAAIEHSSIFTDPLALVWNNPALQPLRYHSSLTEVYAGASLASDYCGGDFSASTWLNSEKANITGYAGYDNGHFSKGILYETDDPTITGPYLMYADGPGTLEKEIYRFGGSYMAFIGRWSVGVQAGYQASLSYRSVDPRPRNVSGSLVVNPAASLRIGGRFLLGLGVRYQRYKQTNDLKFVSELDSNKVYHLTGLATTYSRFDGTATSTYYTGHFWGAQIGLMPLKSGFFAAAEFSTMQITNLLEDLNNLPLAKTVTPTFSGIAGWKNEKRIFAVKGNYERRRGTENIFGDAVSGQYPLIGSLTLYSRTVRDLGMTSMMRFRNTTCGFDASWHSLFEQHLNPLRQMEWQRFSLTARAQQHLPIGSSGFISLNGDLSLSVPLNHSVTEMEPASEDLRKITDAIMRQYHIHSNHRFSGGIGCEALFPVKKKLLLGGEADWHYSFEGIREAVIGIKLMF